jgi:hypothetical protein
MTNTLTYFSEASLIKIKTFYNILLPDEEKKETKETNLGAKILKQINKYFNLENLPKVGLDCLVV